MCVCGGGGPIVRGHTKDSKGRGGRGGEEGEGRNGRGGRGGEEGEGRGGEEGEGRLIYWPRVLYNENVNSLLPILMCHILPPT